MCFLIGSLPGCQSESRDYAAPAASLPAFLGPPAPFAILAHLPQVCSGVEGTPPLTPHPGAQQDARKILHKVRGPRWETWPPASEQGLRRLLLG